MTTDTDDPIRRQMADRGYTLVPRLTHRYAGENLAVCGAAVPDPCPECGQPDVEARCPDCDHLTRLHATPGGECVQRFCTHDESFEIVVAALDRLDR